jgi:hypothetical protein
VAQSSPKLEPWMPVHQNLVQQPKIIHIFNSAVAMFISKNLVHSEVRTLGYNQGDNKEGQHVNMHFFKRNLTQRSIECEHGGVRCARRGFDMTWIAVGAKELECLVTGCAFYSGSLACCNFFAV